MHVAYIATDVAQCTQLHTTVSGAKTAEPINTPVGYQTRVAWRNHITRCIPNPNPMRRGTSDSGAPSFFSAVIKAGCGHQHTTTPMIRQPWTLLISLPWQSQITKDSGSSLWANQIFASEHSLLPQTVPMTVFAPEYIDDCRMPILATLQLPILLLSA